MSTRRDVASPLEVAGAQALLAHGALGRMSAAATVAEFSDAAKELVTYARSIAQSLAVLARSSANDGSERRRAFTAWFAMQVTGVMQHPMQAELARGELPVVYLSRLARGSGHPPIREARMAGLAAVKPKPDDFYFEGADKRPAIAMCAEYLERVTTLLDDSKLALKRFGLE